MWWTQHGHLFPHACENINWDGTQDMKDGLSPAENWYITKYASSNCGVGDTMVQWQQQQDPACPRCGHPKDTTHVYRCTGQQANSVWDTRMSEVEMYLTQSQTDPNIKHVLVMSLSNWHQRAEIPVHQFDYTIQLAVYQQHAIGWKALLEGADGTQWRQAQQKYCLCHQLVQSNRQWLQGLLVCLVQLGQCQWLHCNDQKHKGLNPVVGALKLVYREQ